MLPGCTRWTLDAGSGGLSPCSKFVDSGLNVAFNDQTESKSQFTITPSNARYDVKKSRGIATSICGVFTSDNYRGVN